MSLGHVPDCEILKLWQELVECLHDVNGFGGDVCELYAYRFDMHNPVLDGGTWAETSTIYQEALQTRRRRRKAAMVNLLMYFAEENDCDIQVDGWDLEHWAHELPFEHRVHVRVRRRKSA